MPDTPEFSYDVAQIEPRIYVVLARINGEVAPIGLAYRNDRFDWDGRQAGVVVCKGERHRSRVAKALFGAWRAANPERVT